jgi:hypothetical protein
MTRTDFGFALFQYSLTVLAVGAIITEIAELISKGWPPAQSRWAYPVILISTALLVIMVVAQFIVMVSKFK